MTFDLLLTFSIRDREVVGSNPIAPTFKRKKLAEAKSASANFFVTNSISMPLVIEQADGLFSSGTKPMVERTALRYLSTPSFSVSPIRPFQSDDRFADENQTPCAGSVVFT